MENTDFTSLVKNFFGLAYDIFKVNILIEYSKITNYFGTIFCDYLVLVNLPLPPV